MNNASFDTRNGVRPRHHRRSPWISRIAATAAVALSVSAGAQMPSAPLLQNAWATSGTVGAVELGGGTDGTAYAGAVSFGASRFQFSGGLAYQTRTGLGSRTGYGIRGAMLFGGASSAFGFGAFAGIGGGNTSNSGPDSLASTTQIPLGAALGWRKAFGGTHGVSIYADPAYVLYSGGSESGGLFRVGLGADFGITSSLGATVGAELGATRARGLGGPSGVLYGAGVSYAFGRR